MTGDNGKTPEQIKREEFEADPSMFVSKKDIVIAYVRDHTTGQVQHLINCEHDTMIKVAAFDLTRITQNVCNSMEMQRAKEAQANKVVPASQKSMAQIQRRFK